MTGPDDRYATFGMPLARRARPAVSLAFFLDGFVIAMWVINVPAVKHASGIGNATLGLALLVLGAGAFLAMHLAGQLAARIGSRPTVAMGACLLAAGSALIAAASGALFLSIALFIFGAGNGAIDVAMNDQAVAVQRRYGRSIMSSFHALYSLGGAAGAGLGALLQHAGVGYRPTLDGAAVLAVIVGMIATVRLLPHAASTHPGEQDDDATNAPTPRSVILRRAVLLAVLAFAFMLAEGTVTDWSALQATEHLHESASAASLAYFCFAVTMTVGRLLSDRVVNAVGAGRLVRAGSTIAAIGLVLVVASPLYAVTLFGWALFGTGLAGTVPQIFTAAGALTPGPRGAIMLSRVVSVGYLGILAGPAIIGWISAGTGIDLALLFPLLLVAIGILHAPVVGQSASRAVNHAAQPAPVSTT